MSRYLGYEVMGGCPVVMNMDEVPFFQFVVGKTGVITILGVFEMVGNTK